LWKSFGSFSVFDPSRLTKIVATPLFGEPRPFRNSGVVIGIAIDPAGNRLELIQRP
jgi:hypothetical protein